MRGTAILGNKERQSYVKLDDLLHMLERRPPPTVPGTAVYLASDPNIAPGALLHSLKHFKTLHEHNVALTLVTADVPRVADADRIVMTQINPKFMRVIMSFGYAEEPDVPHGLALCRKLGWKFDIMSTSFLISRRTLRHSVSSEMPAWQSRIYMLLARNAASASDYFNIPSGRVVEIGTQVNL